MATAVVVDIAEMTQKMRIKDSDDERATLSKKISYVLRYGVGKSIELAPDEDGYYKVQDILDLPEICKGVTEKMFKENVNRSNQDKIRYDMKDLEGVTWIKAAGHRGPQTSKADKEKAKMDAAKGGKPGQQRTGSNRAERKGKGISEEEFANKWNLDQLARQKLHDLGPGPRVTAMSQFDPNVNVPHEDFSKVFVAFCKRFRSRGKGNEDDDDDEGDQKMNHDSHTSLTTPLAGAMPFCPGVPWYSVQQNATPFVPWGYQSMPNAWAQMSPWSPGMNFTPAASQSGGYNYGGYNYGHNLKGKGKGKTVYNKTDQSNMTKVKKQDDNVKLWQNPRWKVA